VQEDQVFKNYCINNTEFESVNLVHFWVTDQKVTKKSAAKYYDNSMTCVFYVRTVHLDTIKVFYSPTNAQVIVLKTVLKFTLK
jgi:hypothetical protein